MAATSSAAGRRRGRPRRRRRTTRPVPARPHRRTRSPRRRSRLLRRLRVRRRTRNRQPRAARSSRVRARPGARRERPHAERRRARRRMYGKGFPCVGGTSHLVSRIETFATAMGVCDPSSSLTPRASVPRRGRRAPARLERRAAGRAEPRRGAPRRGQGQPPSLGAHEARSPERVRDRRDPGAPGRRRVVDRRLQLARDGAPIRPLPPRALGRRRVPDAAVWVPRSRSRGACSQSSTPSTR